MSSAPIAHISWVDEDAGMRGWLAGWLAVTPGQYKTIINVVDNPTYAGYDLNGDSLVCANKLDAVRDDKLGTKT